MLAELHYAASSLGACASVTVLEHVKVIVVCHRIGIFPVHPGDPTSTTCPTITVPELVFPLHALRADSHQSSTMSPKKAPSNLDAVQT